MILVLIFFEKGKIVNYFKNELFQRRYILQLHIPKVESGLLQIDPAHRWNFSQTFFEKIKIKK